MSIEFGQRLFAHIAHRDGKESTRENLPKVRNKHEAFSVIDAARSTPNPIQGGVYARNDPWCMPVALALFFRSTLQKETTVVLCFRTLDIEGDAMRSFVEFLENLLEFLGRDQIDGRASPGRDEKENAPEHDVELLEQPDHGVEVLEVGARDRGIDLGRQSDFTCPANRRERPLIGTRYPAKGIVNLGVRPIEAHRQPREAALFQLMNRYPGQQWSGAGSKRDPHATRRSMFHQLKDVRPLQRVAASENENRRPKLPYFINQPLGFFLIQL